MRLVFLGPPGAGKGTQAKKLSLYYNIPQVSTGDILREAISENTEIGNKAKAFMEKGELVPDEVILEIIKDYLMRKECQNGYILDGFPRNLHQARMLNSLLEEINSNLDAVVNFKIKDETIIKRLSGRRVCEDCGTLYHIEFKKPNLDGHCDKCQGRLYQRDDDKEEVIKNRLKVYKEVTSPLIEFYKGENLLKEVEGEGDIEEIFKGILECLNR
jgi:adenylate kinase